ncbi:hypothetical protein TrLO_g7895 [Triparma laevis f. longispina]|uniref:Uncharacterized protein n=1 Tax=Triparma laevis f. longispina TaxID=1714387 RepID=A0A9W7L0W8_9STRA|nr:hypothetical protein TrLO_g7895 [Triparma laevis f. longispina]
MACITFGFTAIYACYAYTDDEDEKEKMFDFWTWITRPISLAFLMFASIQCENSNSDDWRQCNRTLISQTGLSFMIALYAIIKILSGVVPEHILEKHVFSMKKVVAMKMNAEESVQAFGLAIAICCALFSLGGYGANGNFGNDEEKYTAYAVPSFGAGCLFLTAVWKMIAIRGELKRGKEDSEQLRQGESSSSSSEVMLTEARGGIVQKICGSYAYISQALLT